MMIRRFLTSLALAATVVFATAAGAQDKGDDVQIDVLEVRKNVYMLVGGGGNTTVQVGDQGVLLVDSKLQSASDELLATIEDLSDEPIRYIVNTHYHPDHTGGNEPVAAAGITVAGGNVQGDIANVGETAQIVAHENVLTAMSAPTGEKSGRAPDAWPSRTFFTDEKELYFNGEGIEVRHQPAAHTSGDTIVYFRQSNVIATGDVYTTTNYPVIDVKNGGTINGVIDALNEIIEICIPVYGQDGGTLVVPGHGRLSNIGDVINYREMVTIIRDRVQHMIDQGMSLEEVKAARPTRDYDPRYGSSEGFWTTEMFVEAVYNTLKKSN